MRKVNIDFRKEYSPEFFIWDHDTGKQFVFVKSINIYADVHGYKCDVTFWVKNDEGLYGEKTEVETVRINSFETVQKGKFSTGELRDEENFMKWKKERHEN